MPCTSILTQLKFFNGWKRVINFNEPIRPLWRVLHKVTGIIHKLYWGLLGNWELVYIAEPTGVYQKSRNFSVATILFISSPRRGSKPSNFVIFLVFLTLKHSKRSAFQNKRIAVLQLAFWARKVLGPFEKQAQGLSKIGILSPRPPVSESVLAPPRLVCISVYQFKTNLGVSYGLLARVR